MARRVKGMRRGSDGGCRSRSSARAANAFGEGAQQFDSHAALAEALGNALRAGVTVLVKGSRGSAMDNIVTALLARDAASGKESTTDAA